MIDYEEWSLLIIPVYVHVFDARDRETRVTFTVITRPSS